MNVWALTAIGDTILVGTDDGHVLLSPDLGNTWSDRSGSLPSGYVKGIGIAAGNDLVCVAGGRVHISDDWSNWTAVSPFLGGPTGVLIRDSTILVALEINGGLQASFDLGTSWQQIGSGYGTSVSLSSSNDTILFGRYGANLQRSVDHGTTWTNVNGVIGTTIFSLSETGLYAGSGTTLYRRVNNGWTTEPLNMQVLDIAVHDNYVAACGDPGGSTEGLYMSLDFGTTWTPIGSPPIPRKVALTDGHLFGGVGWGGTDGLWKLDLAAWAGIQDGMPAAGFNLAPNPASNVVRLSFNALSTSGTHCEVIDPLGRLVHGMPIASGSTGAELDLAGLAPGRYTVRLVDMHGMRSAALVVLR